MIIVTILENDKAKEYSGIPKPDPNSGEWDGKLFCYHNAYEFWKIYEDKMRVFEIDYTASQPHPFMFKHSKSPYYEYKIGTKYNAEILPNGKVKIESEY